MAAGSIGAALSEARAARDMTVEDVARVTRVRATLIRAIEHEDFSLCGGAVYARGHLRSIAAAVGLDPAPLVAEYDRLHGSPVAALTPPAPAAPVAKRFTVRPAPAERAAREPAPARPAPAAGEAGAGLLAARREVLAGRRGPNWAGAMALALVAVIVLAAVDLATGHHAAGGAAARAGAAHRTATTARPGPAPTGQPPKNAIAFAGVTVEVRLQSAPSWLHVTDDTGAVQFQGLLQPGQVREFHAAHSLAFVIGNAGAVDLIVNGHDVGPAGAPGQVVNPVFTPSSSNQA